MCQCKSCEASRQAVSASKEYKSSRPGASCNFITRVRKKENVQSDLLSISGHAFVVAEAV
jgi:hypothetical protein